MADRTLNRLRATRLYARLKNVAVEPSDCAPCGWRAEVVGDFTGAEHNQANEIVRDLQRRFSLRKDPLHRQASPKSDPSDIS
jgi:hypothetical protein